MHCAAYNDDIAVDNNNDDDNNVLCVLCVQTWSGMETGSAVTDDICTESAVCDNFTECTVSETPSTESIPCVNSEESIQSDNLTESIPSVHSTDSIPSDNFKESVPSDNSTECAVCDNNITENTSAALPPVKNTSSFIVCHFFPCFGAYFCSFGNV